MDEQELRELITAVKAGRGSRRSFMRKIVALGLTVPFASQLLAHAGLAQSPMPVEYKPSRAGGGGALRTLFWLAPTSLNPHFGFGGAKVRRAEMTVSWIHHLDVQYEPLLQHRSDRTVAPTSVAP